MPDLSTQQYIFINKWWRKRFNL